jgi:polyribonucleotide nucleotidyltransferase
MIDRPIRPLWPKGYLNEVQCIATVLSADLITAHDILAINGVSAALMISPMPFMGPIGAVRIGLVDGELAVNPSLPEQEENDELDLIVVGTKDGLTMVEAGANQIPEERLLEALDLAQQALVKLCEAQERLRHQAGKPKWLDAEVTSDRDARFGQEIVDSLRQHGLHEGAAITAEILEREAGRLSMESTENDITRELQVRMSLAQLLEKKRSQVTEAPVREQFENDLRALTEAEQDSKGLKSAKQHLLYERIIDGVQLPFPIGPMNGIGEIISAAETPLIARMSCAVIRSAESTVAMHCTSLR